jgi:FKBP-type peptidyl-prolyl cis-trans isomerase
MKKIFTVIFVAIAMISMAQKEVKSKKSKLHKGYMESDGMIYKFYKQNKKGVKAKEGDVVRVIMWYKTSKDSMLFSSEKLNHNGNNYIEFPIPKPGFKGSLEHGLAMMTTGDSASFLINADSLYRISFNVPELPNFIEKNSFLNFNVKLLKFISKDSAAAEAEEREIERRVTLFARQKADSMQMNEYIIKNNITSKPTASGLYYIEKTKGTGGTPVKGCKVKVNYTLRNLDGKVLDTSDKDIAVKAGMNMDNNPFEPLQIPVGEGLVIPGFDEALMMMSVGTKALLIIPPYLGYGEQGGGPIEPYTTLVFDVEMISFTAAQ